MDKQKNLNCDIETGLCAPSSNDSIEQIQIGGTQKVQLIYYTDPICSSCWAIEPELKKFKLAYGHHLTVDYRMGGLLPKWEGFADKGNGIGQPSDVAHHWDEVGQYTAMSIDGDVWLEDPLHSSYPPSIAVKAIQKQGDELAVKYLRIIREMVFLQKKNITQETHLLAAAEQCGADTAQFLKDYKDPATEQAFLQEVQTGRRLGVRGFPTFIFVNPTGAGFKISGSSGYNNYVLALEQALGQKANAQSIDLSITDLLKKYPYLATKEIAVILDLTMPQANEQLAALAKQGLVEKDKHKYGDFWQLR